MGEDMRGLRSVSSFRCAQCTEGVVNCTPAALSIHKILQSVILGTGDR